jgi:hypothetical protein
VRSRSGAVASTPISEGRTIFVSVTVYRDEPAGVFSSMKSFTRIRRSGRKYVSRCAAIPMLPLPGGSAVLGICPAPRLVRHRLRRRLPKCQDLGFRARRLHRRGGPREALGRASTVFRLSHTWASCCAFFASYKFHQRQHKTTAPPMMRALPNQNIAIVAFAWMAPVKPETFGARRTRMLCRSLTSPDRS